MRADSFPIHQTHLRTHSVNVIATDGKVVHKQRMVGIAFLDQMADPGRFIFFIPGLPREVNSERTLNGRLLAGLASVPDI